MNHSGYRIMQLNRPQKTQKTQKEKHTRQEQYFGKCDAPLFSCIFFCVFCVFCGRFSSVSDAQTRPMTLAESVALALKQSPQARAAGFARDAAQVQADREKPVARPTVSVSASTTAQEPRVTFPYPNYAPATVLPESYSKIELSIEQVLYRAGIGAARQRYAAQSGAVSADYRREISALALAVRKAYLDVLRAESGLRDANDGLKAAQDFQVLTETQIAAGLAKPVDAQTAKAQTAEAQSGVTLAESGLTLARMNFNRFIGRPLSAEVVLEPLADAPPVPEKPDAAIALALKSRPELQSLAQNLAAATAGISLAKTQNQPSLSVRGTAIEQTQTAFLPQHYAAATLEIRWNVFDGGRTRLDTQEAKAQSQRLQALLEDTRQAITLDVMQAWEKLRDTQSQIAAAETRLTAAQSAETVADTAYQVGRGTLLEAQAAQREVRTARERLTRARYDLLSADADFDHAQGNLTPQPPSLIRSLRSQGRGEREGLPCDGSP